jgi:hypothetical protein
MLMNDIIEHRTDTIAVHVSGGLPDGGGVLPNKKMYNPPFEKMYLIIINLLFL